MPYSPPSEDKAQFTIDINLEADNDFLDVINALDDKLLEHFTQREKRWMHHVASFPSAGGGTASASAQDSQQRTGQTDLLTW